MPTHRRSSPASGQHRDRRAARRVGSRRVSLRVTFLAPNLGRPVGGTTAIYHFANGLCRLGHEVHLVHFALGPPAAEPEAIDWFDFDHRLQHHGPERPEDDGPPRIPDADIIVGYHKSFPARCGLPTTLIQGFGIFVPEIERDAYWAPGPKICVARWLVESGRALGVPARQLVHVPYGIDHDKYLVTSPPGERGPRVAMLYNSHYNKGAEHGLAALVEVKRRRPELDVMLFGNSEPRHEIPSWMTFHQDPDQWFLVDEIYNGSRVFVCASLKEGFGFANVEAMACGSALVTTANGGSDDYAVHHQTALVSQPGDVDTMAENIDSLLGDEPMRLRLVEQGIDRARRFDWDQSARTMATFFEAYLDDPGSY